MSDIRKKVAGNCIEPEFGGYIGNRVDLIVHLNVISFKTMIPLGSKLKKNELLEKKKRKEKGVDKKRKKNVQQGKKKNEGNERNAMLERVVEKKLKRNDEFAKKRNAVNATSKSKDTTGAQGLDLEKLFIISDK